MQIEGRRFQAIFLASPNSFVRCIARLVVALYLLTVGVYAKDPSKRQLWWSELRSTGRCLLASGQSTKKSLALVKLLDVPLLRCSIVLREREGDKCRPGVVCTENILGGFGSD